MTLYRPQKAISVLDPSHKDYAAYAEKVVGYMKRGDYDALGEVVSGMIQAEQTLEDIVGPILGELNWTDVTGKDQRFQAPSRIIGNKATTMENGMTLPTAKITKNKVYVPIEEIVTPEYPADTRDIKAGDVVTIVEIKNWAMNALIVQKALRLYKLLASDAKMTDATVANSRLTVIEDDGTFTYDNVPTYVPYLRRAIEDAVSRLQDVVGGRPQIKGFGRQVTLDLLERTGVTGVEWYAIPAAAEDDGLDDGTNHRPYFTEGDLILVAPGAASVAQIEEIEASTRQISHFNEGYAWRWSHKWVMWNDKYLRRFVICQKRASAALVGSLTLDSFDANGMTLYSTVALKKSTITSTNLIVSETPGGAGTQLTGGSGALTYTVSLDADMRHVRITFGGTKPSAGSTYYVRSNASGITDAFGGTGHYLDAMAEVTVTVGAATEGS